MVLVGLGVVGVVVWFVCGGLWLGCWFGVVVWGVDDQWYFDCVWVVFFLFLLDCVVGVGVVGGWVGGDVVCVLMCRLV